MRDKGNAKDGLESGAAGNSRPGAAASSAVTAPSEAEPAKGKTAAPAFVADLQPSSPLSATWSDGPLFSHGASQVRAFAPGRAELAGNHVDHQRGRVLSAAVDRGVSIEAAPNGLELIRVESGGFEPFAIELFPESCEPRRQKARELAAAQAAGMPGVPDVPGAGGPTARVHAYACGAPGIGSNAPAAFPALEPKRPRGSGRDICDKETCTKALEPIESERNTSAALVRGMASCFVEAGYVVRGCDLRVASTLPASGGLSSSAAFELAVGQALNALFARGAVPALQLAQWGKRAECEWFGKPSGLQDQTISACGGVALMDFADPAEPQLHRIDFDFAQAGYAVILVNVHCDHSQNPDAFAQIPRDMQAAAQLLDAEVLGQRDEECLLANLPRVRAELGDRVALRALHFYREDDLVMRRVAALERGDMPAFLRWTAASGASSAQYLQNVSEGGREQPAMVALALADRLLDDRGAVRIHGGGFGGTIQAYVPLSLVDEFCAKMDDWLGAGSCLPLSIGGSGAYAEPVPSADSQVTCP